MVATAFGSLRAGARSARPAERALRLVVMLVLLAPAWLGPTARPLAVALGFWDHLCACGMAPGKCGCPECERIEHERHAQGAHPALKSSCDQGDGAIPGTVTPPCVLPPALTLGDPTAASVSHAPGERRPSSLNPRPPTPPPRNVWL